MEHARGRGVDGRLRRPRRAGVRRVMDAFPQFPRRLRGLRRAAVLQADRLLRPESARRAARHPDHELSEGRAGAPSVAAALRARARRALARGRAGRRVRYPIQHRERFRRAARGRHSKRGRDARGARLRAASRPGAADQRGVRARPRHDCDRVGARWGKDRVGPGCIWAAPLHPAQPRPGGRGAQRGADVPAPGQARVGERSARTADPRASRSVGAVPAAARRRHRARHDSEPAHDRARGRRRHPARAIPAPTHLERRSAGDLAVVRRGRELARYAAGSGARAES